MATSLHNRCACVLACLTSLFLSPVNVLADPGVVASSDLVPFGTFSSAAPGFELPKVSPGLPLIDSQDNSPEAALLRRLEAQGKAAGFDGVIYDNRDRDHSPLPLGLFPRLARLFYADDLKKFNFHVGLAGRVILPAIVIGNSSTAITGGHRQRSQPRLAMTSAQGPYRAFLTYVTNHLYIYPEHLDHDKIDMFPASWPYMVISQGSSFSDQPFMRALLMSVAAFSPETRKKLTEKNLIAPTLQMILRRSQKAIYSRQAYLSGRAHPTVFHKKQLAPERMVALALSIKPDQIPPMVYLTVDEEDFVDAAGLAGLTEKLFDTPSAIARSWRSMSYTRRMVVSAAKTADPNGHPLQFSWVLLQGDPDKVRITPSQNGTKADISVDWHDPWRADPKHERVTSRVDIGVFAWNGFHDSAPAVISIDFPGHQIRNYQDVPGGPGKQLVTVDYDAVGRNAKYDPEIFWSAPWTDTLIYDADGLLDKTRRQTGDKTIEISARNQTESGQPVHYALNSKKKNRFLEMTIAAKE